MRAIARYGVRSIPGDEKEIVAAFRRGEAVEGPAIKAFEKQFARIVANGDAGDRLQMAVKRAMVGLLLTWLDPGFHPLG